MAPDTILLEHSFYWVQTSDKVAKRFRTPADLPPQLPDPCLWHLELLETPLPVFKFARKGFQLVGDPVFILLDGDIGEEDDEEEGKGKSDHSTEKSPERL